MKLIDKDALVAEIERLKERFIAFHHRGGCDWPLDNYGKMRAYNELLSIIDTLEVKEVDLKKEIQNVIHNHFFDLDGIAIAGTSSYATVDDMVYIAKHFFELGLRVNNEKEK